MRYQITHANFAYGADEVLKDVSFEIKDKEKIAIVGRNGCGKTTFLKLIAGDLEAINPDSDESFGITVSGHQEIGFLRQISFEDGEISVFDEIKKVFSPVFECENRMTEIEHALKDGETEALLGEYAFLQKKMDALHGYSWKRDLEIMFSSFGFDESDLHRPIGNFSGGQQTKIAFIKLLLSRPDIMLLDEPTNHLDLVTIEWLEDYLKNYDKSVVIVSHDRMFLDRVIDVTYEIEYHCMKRYVGNYSAFMKQKEENLQKQEKDYEAQQKEIKRLTEWIEKWKNTPTKVSSAHSKEMQIAHMQLIEKPRRFDASAFRAQFTPRIESYSDVLNCKKLVVGYDKPLAEVSFLLNKKERLAIIGENGIGKSTLLKTLVGEIEPLGGSYNYGTNVEPGYFDQQKAVMDDSDPNMSVLDNFWEAYPNLDRQTVRSALGAFLFSGEEVEKLMGGLSGGEKVRLSLCKMFFTKPNLLILDEPTNHMDMIGKEALEKMLREYDGTVLFVSHDRYFINRVATGILEFDSDEVVYYPYGYEDYLYEKKKRKDRLSAAVTESSSSVKNDSSDVLPEKKAYFNPGKVKSKLLRQKEKLEASLSDSEEKTALLKEKLADPTLSSDYQKLMELQNDLDNEEKLQEEYLEQLLEVESELNEL